MYVFVATQTNFSFNVQKVAYPLNVIWEDDTIGWIYHEYIQVCTRQHFNYDSIHKMQTFNNIAIFKKSDF